MVVLPNGSRVLSEGEQTKISLSGSSTDLRTYQGTGFALPTASLTGSQVSAVRQPRGVSTPLFFNFFQNRYEMQKGPLTNHLLVLNAVELSGPLVLLTEPPVEYGVLLIFLTCHSYLLFVGAGRYGNTKYTAPASASLLKLYCS